MIDAKAFGEELAAIVKAACAPLEARIKALEETPVTTPRDGVDGKDADPVEVAQIVSDDLTPRLAEVSAAVDEIRAKMDAADVDAMVSDAVEKAVAAIPAPKDGKDADPAEIDAAVDARVKEAVEGIRSDDLPGLVADAVGAGVKAAIDDVTNDALPAMVNASLPAMVDKAVAESVAKIPAPKDGAPGEKGEKGEPGTDGRDGIGMAGALIDRDGTLVVTLSNGEAKALGPVVGRDGADGDNGAPGLGFEDMDFTVDEHGRPVAKFSRGDVVKTFALPCIIDRGIFRQGEAYQKGDATTYGGSLWLAQCETGETPGTGKDWRLAVKKGRDARPPKVKDSDA